jgi:4'-phosphopantetheinyl transferase
MSGHSFEPVPHELPAGVQLWWVDLDVYAEVVALEGLCAGEHARAARMAFERDARRYLAGRHALRQIIGTALDRSPEALVIEPDDFGKPRLVDTEGPYFNLAHSAREALIGVSPDQAIGVDIEVVREVVDAEALAREHFTDEERAEWSRAEPARDRAFLACWTRKEACVKALGVGLSAQPASLEVGCAPSGRVVTVPLGTGPCEVTLQSLQLPGDAVAAVALAAPEVVSLARRFFRRA